MKYTTPHWPNDADGDALRRIWSDGVDFSKLHLIDFQVDFNKWPPSNEALQILHNFQKVRLIHTGEHEDGYVEISMLMRLGYDEVIGMEKLLTILLREYSGFCECWGMMAE